MEEEMMELLRYDKSPNAIDRAPDKASRAFKEAVRAFKRGEKWRGRKKMGIKWKGEEESMAKRINNRI
jgi:hypothetical protein